MTAVGRWVMIPAHSEGCRWSLRPYTCGGIGGRLRGRHDSSYFPGCWPSPAASVGLAPLRRRRSPSASRRRGPHDHPIGCDRSRSGRPDRGVRRQLHRAGRGDQELDDRRRRRRCRQGSSCPPRPDRALGRRHDQRQRRRRRPERLHDHRPRSGDLRRSALRGVRPRRRERDDSRQRDHGPASKPAQRLPEGESASASAGPQRRQTSGTATIANNVITDYQKGGIVVDGPGSAATITNNVDHGSRPNRSRRAERHPGEPAGDRDSLRQHGVRGTFTREQKAKSIGILLFDALSDVTVSNNTISASDWGIGISSRRPEAAWSLCARTRSGRRTRDHRRRGRQSTR